MHARIPTGRPRFLPLLATVTPLLLGWGVSAYFLPGADPLVHVFIGATLTATSVGLTARVLRDLGRINTKEARIILGAAVIDDVMGLVLLAAVSGLDQVTLSTMLGALDAAYADTQGKQRGRRFRLDDLLAEPHQSPGQAR